jgi:hypothetical protein
MSTWVVVCPNVEGALRRVPGGSKDQLLVDRFLRGRMRSRAGLRAQSRAFVDDILIHGPACEQTSQALTKFLDLAVDCGMLCHPTKLTPPQLVVKCYGFLLDSVGIPCLHVPVAKRERALAIVDHLLESPAVRENSRLSLAIAAGVLQSFVEAMPLRSGHTCLRMFHSLVRPPGLGSGLEPCLTTCCVSEGVRVDLRWWRMHLRHENGRFSRSVASATFAPVCGDGGGTGTDGAFKIDAAP